MRRVRAGLFAVAASLASGGLEAETLHCTAITSLPFTITAQGSYCLVGDLSWTSIGGTAIQIKSDFVNLDLNGFALDGGAGGSATTAIGIYAYRRRNIVIRGGSIRGFMYALRIEDDPATGYSTGGAHVVEGLRLRGNTVRGIRVQGRGCQVRGNQVVDTRGTTFFSDVTTVAIEARGPGTRVLDNVVVETVGRGSGSGVGIWVIGPAPVIADNAVSNASLPTGGPTSGIAVTAAADALLTRNRVISMSQGVVFDAASSGKYRDNLTHGCAVPYSAGSGEVQDAGNNL